MTGAGLAQIVGLLLSLALVSRGMRAHQLGRRTLIWFAAAWTAIIAVLALGLDHWK